MSQNYDFQHIENLYKGILSETLSSAVKRKIASFHPTINCGGKLTFRIPNNGIPIGDIFLEIELANPRAGYYTTLPAWSLLNNVIVRHDQQVLHNYEYRNVMHYFRSTWPSKKRELFEAAAGGINSRAGLYYAPIPTFWTNFHKSSGSAITPLPPLKYNSNIFIDVELQSIRKILTPLSDGGSIKSINLVYYEYNISDDNLSEIHEKIDSGINILYSSIDWKTIDTQIMLGTQLNVNCFSVINNNIIAIDYYATSKQDQNNRNEYFNVIDAFTQVELVVNHNSIYIAGNSNREYLLDSIIANTDNSYGLHGFSKKINFNSQRQGNSFNKEIKSLYLKMQQNSGMDIYVNTTAICNALYIVKNGIISNNLS